MKHTDKHTTTDATEILAQRGTVYGKYIDGVICRANIMQALNDVYRSINGVDLPSDLRVMFTDLVLKLMRAASCPSHIDTWVDLEGYSKLVKEVMIEQWSTNEN